MELVPPEDLRGYTEDEAYAFLAGIDLTSSEATPIIVAAAEVHTGAMIALIPSEDDARRLAVAGGEPQDQLHTTLVYLGEADDIAANARRRLIHRVHDALASRGDIAADGFSVNVFNPPGTAHADDKDRDSCIVLGLSGREIDQVHKTVAQVVNEVEATSPGLQVPEQHTPWIPHITLTYTDDVDRVARLVDRVGPVKFDRVRLAFAGENVDIPLSALLTAAADDTDEFHLKDKHDQRDHNPHKGFKVIKDDKLTRRVKALTDSLIDNYKQLNTGRTQRDKYGAWKPQRDAIHRQIVDDLFKKAADVPNEGHALLLGGSAGAGKSTVLKQGGIDTSKFLVISPDDIKEELAKRGLIPELPGGDFSPMERSTMVHQESVRIGDMLADRAFRERKNIIWDGSMGNAGLVFDRVKRMDKMGYNKIDALFVDVSDETSRRRAAARYKQGQQAWLAGNGEGGRFVPPVIQNALSSAEVRFNFGRLRKANQFDNWAVYENDVDGQPAKLQSRKGAL
jgi:Zeta toxin/2'-5' RNA ligase superfamily